MSGLFIKHPPPWQLQHAIVYDRNGKVVDVSDVDTRGALVKAVNQLFRKRKTEEPSQGRTSVD